MVQQDRKLPKVFDYFIEKDQFAGGTTYCSGCLAELAVRTIPKVLGKDMIFFSCPCCSAPVLHGQNLGAWHKLPYYACVMTGVPSSASGVSRYLRMKGNEDTTICCFTGDGDAGDVGFQILSGAAERNERMMYVCYDNEGYMNTGNQRSSSTPYHAATATTPVGKFQKGKPQVAKNLPIIMAMHPIAYAATACLSNMEDYAIKLKKAQAASKHGFAYVHVFAPCIIGFRIGSDASIQVCRMAVRTNYFPLWEMEEGKFRFTASVENPRPIKDYVSLVGKLSHFKDDDIAEFQKIVDDRFKVIKALVDNCGDK
ncbi:MAG TPA: thiamine pyrophosphate-dependent enzyme [Dehalococcoidales bacterium]|nr:thiamine pyrophosphate-dependent enzyme [Dehalococcoidales bacterium]